MTDAPRRRPPRAGDLVPEFSGATDAGAVVTTGGLLGRATVLFFYPKAGSPGCSIESRGFARHHAEFEAAGVRVVGISVDGPDAQRRFREKCDLPFDLITDTQGEISERFGVLGALGVARRTTFLLDPTGRIVDVVRSWRPTRHVDVALERLVRVRRSAGAAGPPPASPEL
ncbi:MAG TPA: peroxiredoxin [Thermoplasmata archaeon]|nr:peroxiredoxin [Thermoplasmata archaeon]